MDTGLPVLWLWKRSTEVGGGGGAWGTSLGEWEHNNRDSLTKEAHTVLLSFASL